LAEFVNTIGMSELLQDSRFTDGHRRAANGRQLVEILDRLFESQPLAHWKATVDAGRVIFGVVQNFDEIINDQQMLAKEVLVPLAKPNWAANTHGQQPCSHRGPCKGTAAQCSAARRTSRRRPHGTRLFRR
jgi:formyl-CoA transferase